MARDQIGITFKPHERELLEAIAKEMGKPLAAVIRECALEGLDSFLEKLERRQKFLKNLKDTPDE